MLKYNIGNNKLYKNKNRKKFCSIYVSTKFWAKYKKRIDR